MQEVHILLGVLTTYQTYHLPHSTQVLTLGFLHTGDPSNDGRNCLRATHTQCA